MRIVTENIETEWCVTPSTARYQLVKQIDEVMSLARTNGYWRQEPAILSDMFGNDGTTRYKGKARILLTSQAAGYIPIKHGWERQYMVERMMYG